MQKIKYKKQFITWVVRHIRLVQDLAVILELNLNKLPFKIEEWEILNRCMQHDLDKFQTNKADGYVKLEEYLDNKRNNINNNYIDKSTLYNCSNMHYNTQRHHTQYHDINNEEYSNIDICEICCDIFAESIIKNEGDCGKGYCLNTLFPNNPKLNKQKDNIFKIFDLLAENYNS